MSRERPAAVEIARWRGEGRDGGNDSRRIGGVDVRFTDRKAEISISDVNALIALHVQWSGIADLEAKAAQV